MTDIDSALSRLVTLGLKEANLSVLEEMLRALAEQCGGFGATLWQLRDVRGNPPGKVNLDHIRANPPLGRLYVLADGFEDSSYRCAYHDLPLRMATGQAVILPEGEYEVTDAEDNPQVDRDFARTAKPGSLYAVRVSFPDNSVGAITLYRRKKGPFDLQVRETFRFLAAHIPALYVSVRDRVAYRLVDRISVVLADAESLQPAEHQSHAETNEDGALKEVCKLVSNSLGCLETSIFLPEQDHDGGFYAAATSCPTLLRANRYGLHDRGITPYILRSGIPRFIFDLSNMPASLQAHTGWKHLPGLTDNVRDLFRHQQGERPLPWAFAGVPLLNDGKVIGVLRCSICNRAPYYLAEHEIELLVILANRIAGYWRRRLRLKEINDAEKSWALFVDGLSELTRRTQTLTEKSKTTRTKEALQQEIYTQALDILRRSIHGADALEVTLVDADRKTIGPVAGLGRDWEEFFPPGGETGRALPRFPLNPPVDNSWAYVCNRKELEFIEDTSTARIPYAGLLPNTRQAIFVPILVDDICVGVLGIRSHEGLRAPAQANSMATLAALVAALYYQLTTILGQQLQVYQDLEHQLRSPIFQAYKRIGLVVQEEKRKPTEELEGRMGDLYAVSELLSKARRVLGNIRLYEQLAMEQNITLNLDSVPISEIIKLMIEAAIDNRLLWRSKNMSFWLDRPSFERLKFQEILLDVALFEQVMNNLLDNGGKYGDPGSQIRIEGSQDEEGLFAITVSSRGLALSEGDLEHLGKRGFRSKNAKLRTAEGIGSGLYLVSSIIRAHHGKFTAQATNAQGWTSITAAFPTAK